MACAGIDLDVMVDAERGEGFVQPGRGAAAQRRTVLAAVAAHDRARTGQGLLGVLRAAAVVDAGGRKTVAGGQCHRVGPPMQMPITPILPVHRSWRASQPRTLSMSSKVRPWPAAISRMIVHRQRSRLPQ